MRGTIREHAIVGKRDSNLVFPTCCLCTESVKSIVFVLSKDETYREAWQL